MDDSFSARVNFLTICQYRSHNPKDAKIKRYIESNTFTYLGNIAQHRGFEWCHLDLIGLLFLAQSSMLPRGPECRVT